MFKGLSLTLLLLAACTSPATDPSSETVTPSTEKRNLILFVADGLRAASVKPQLTPHLFKLKSEGTWFANSHAIFPTSTMTNAAALATGHFAGDHGLFNNAVFTGFPVATQQNTVVPSLETNASLNELEVRLHHLPAEETLLAVLRKAGFSTAALGKHGPLRVQDEGNAFPTSTLLIDDGFSRVQFENFAADIKQEFLKQKLSLAAPASGTNPSPGHAKVPGIKQANVSQQKYFMDVLTKVLLPTFKKRNVPFAIVFWSRDPDGTHHFQGDSLGKLVPGINGPTSLAAINNVDNNLGDLRAALKRLALEATTDLIVTSDHGFSTISKQSKTSRAAQFAYANVPAGALPSGFLAIDLAYALSLKIYNASTNAAVDPVKGEATAHAVLGRSINVPEMVVVQNGGSDFIYLSDKFSSKKRIADLLKALVAQDYVSGIFVHDKLGEWPATLPLSKLQLLGKTKLPEPSLLVGFKSFSTGCRVAVECTALVSDTPLQQGQGMHGSLSRADSFNFMAAVGPSFKSEHVLRTPIGTTDILPTVLFSRQLTVKHVGPAKGRILYESLRGVPNKNIMSQSIEFISPQALEGFKTVLNMQLMDNTVYFDAAGFLGRTVGLQ